MHSIPFIPTSDGAVARLALAAISAVAVMLALVFGAPTADAAAKQPSKPLTEAVAKRIAKQNATARVASVTDPSLSANLSRVTLQTFPWYSGGGSCTASGSALWNRASNLLSLNGSAHTSAPFSACRARLRVSFWASDMGSTYNLGSAAADIATACANTDPSCPSTQPLNVVLYNAIPGTFFGIRKSAMVSYITLSAERR